MKPTDLRFAAATAIALLGTGAVQAHDDRARARLSSYQEVPALSSAAAARFVAKLGVNSFTYELTYSGLESNVTQSHIHFGQKSVNGGIAIFLCTNLGNGPVSTQACPLGAGTITGTVGPADVIGLGGQGISAGQWDELIRAMRAGITYANIHTIVFPGGEVRGQIEVD